ncbi:unnamed protein product [Cylicocyclus nassatus]|uniref:BHLH domain-containing protein n=1 Tax=Cylicocyclus nassatus TaxID=53992 RepID=A0AA36M5Q4_CYLNA|nr:unnamed protein product [Cylicocyclus nassatus]
MIDDKFANADRFTIQRQINPQYDESSDAERRSEPKRWQKQPTIVAKRNARERTRVHTVNQAFVTLKYHLPSLRSHTKRVSKLKILNAAIRYIDSLVDLLKTCDANASLTTFPSERRHRHALAEMNIKHDSPLPMNIAPEICIFLMEISKVLIFPLTIEPAKSMLDYPPMPTPSPVAQILQKIDKIDIDR